jgi:hypothetical protein
MIHKIDFAIRKFIMKIRLVWKYRNHRTPYKWNGV